MDSPKPGSARASGPCLIHAVEPLENARLVFFRDADAGVGHLDHDLFRSVGVLQLADLQLDLAAVLRVAYGIGQQIQQNLAQLVFIRFDKQLLGNVGMERNPFFSATVAIVSMIDPQKEAK